MGNSFFAFAERLSEIPVKRISDLDFRINKLAEELLEYSSIREWGKEKEKKFRDVMTCTARIVTILEIENLNNPKTCNLSDMGAKILKLRSLHDLWEIGYDDYCDGLECHIKDMVLTITDMTGYDLPNFYELALDKAVKVAVKQGFRID